MIDPLLITLFILVLEARGLLRAGEGEHAAMHELSKLTKQHNE
jgi:hypothetical protein